MARWSVPGVVHLQEGYEDWVGRREIARHHITRRPLTVTYLSQELLTDTEFRTRFARDVVPLVSIRDARVARVHRYVECHDGAAVIGERVHGTSLRDLLLAHGALGIEAALVVLSDALHGLAAWHTAGLAHGDIKPEDLIVTPAGRVRLVDFGLWTLEGRRLLTRSTPFYLAPEQWSGPRATSAGDVYAGTVTFFECLMGAPPFYADGSTELATKHEQDPAPIDLIPRPVRELVRGGLDKDPHSRPEARRLLTEVAEVVAHSVGAGWEQRGRRELSRLVTNRSTLPEMPALYRRGAGVSSAPRRPVRLAAVIGGALALAAGLASPPLAVLPVGPFYSDAKSPVLAFPEPAPDADQMINGRRTDRTVRTRTASAAKAAPAGRVPVARAQPDRALPLAPSIPEARPQIPMAGYPRPSVPVYEAARPQSASALTCTPMRMAQYKPCSAPVPRQQAPWSPGTASETGPVQLPVLVEVPVPVKLPLADLVSPNLLAPKNLRQNLPSSKDIELPQHLPQRPIQQGWERAAHVRQTGQPSTASPGADESTTDEFAAERGTQSEHSR